MTRFWRSVNLTGNQTENWPFYANTENIAYECWSQVRAYEI